MPEPRDLTAETLGLIAAGIPAAVAIHHYNQPHPTLKNLPLVDHKAFAQQAKPGDIILSSVKSPYSGWRALARALNMSPYYHAEMVYGKGRDVRRGMVTWGGQGAPVQYKPSHLPFYESSVLLRPKTPLSRDERKRLYDVVKKTFSKNYAVAKVPITGAQRLTLPAIKGMEKLPNLCSGDTCSTGPASVYRALGRKGMPNVPPGTEMGGDYLRSKQFRPVAVSGTKYNIPAELKKQLAVRLGLSAALGYGTYKTIDSFRQGDYAGPIGTAAGAGAGAALGAGIESLMEHPTRLKNLAAKTNSPVLKKVLRVLAKTQKRFPLWVPAATTVLGGLAGHKLTQ